MDKITGDHFADSQMEAFLRKTRTSALHQKYLPESFSGAAVDGPTDGQGMGTLNAPRLMSS